MADFVKSPEFAEDAQNIATDIPRAKDAPEAPTDIRSARQWDSDARALESLRDSAIPKEVAAGGGTADPDAQYETLKAKAQAYKKDDPASGPVEGFPKYKPRR